MREDCGCHRNVSPPPSTLVPQLDARAADLYRTVDLYSTVNLEDIRTPVAEPPASSAYAAGRFLSYMRWPTLKASLWSWVEFFNIRRFV